MKLDFPTRLSLNGADPESVEVNCNYTVTRDPLGTGDSPPEFTIEDIKIFRDDGTLADESEYSESEVRGKAYRFLHEEPDYE